MDGMILTGGVEDGWNDTARGEWRMGGMILTGGSGGWME